MSWLTRNLVDPLLSIFDSSSLAQTPGQNADFNSIATGGLKLPDTSSRSNFDFGNILTQYGLPLAQTYFAQSQGKSNAQNYAEMAAAQIAAEKEMLDKKLAADLEAARISAGASGASARIAAESAKRNTLANLYASWADLANKTGQQKAAQASQTAANMNEGAVARARVLV